MYDAVRGWSFSCWTAEEIYKTRFRSNSKGRVTVSSSLALLQNPDFLKHSGSSLFWFDLFFSHCCNPPPPPLPRWVLWGHSPSHPPDTLIGRTSGASLWKTPD